jgi:hypothetical protein
MSATVSASCKNALVETDFVSHWQWPYDSNDWLLETDDSDSWDDEREYSAKEIDEQVDLDEDIFSDEEYSLDDNKNPDSNVPESEQAVDPQKVLYLEWEKLVAEHGSRGLTRSTDKIPGFLGLRENGSKRTFKMSLWSGFGRNYIHFLVCFGPSTEAGGRSRNRNYPFWTWAFLDG